MRGDSEVDRLVEFGGSYICNIFEKHMMKANEFSGAVVSNDVNSLQRKSRKFVDLTKC